jgi:hypothetical protein
MLEAVLSDDLPRSAAWEHREARRGFEVLHTRRDGSGLLLSGCTTGVEDGHAWWVSYDLAVDPSWGTRRAEVLAHSVAGVRHVLLESEGDGRWMINKRPAPHLEGCFDVDLESSAMTNALPVHRLALPVGRAAQAPAAYVVALDATVERLEQSYQRLPDEEPGERYAYTAPDLDFRCTLVYDTAGLVLRYPGIAIRVA